ncbi:hypothetical protein EYC58_00015 [Candidatus Saccharibacteria bacterium]|nr:MAG: hypothetical protein EYC58_00015 [Candidatus Saccharibacteria bacterium]
MKNDKYSQARGGWSRMLAIACEKCGQHICYYQKDGPGPLKRMYLDRIIGASPAAQALTCKHCGQELGVKIVYQKENRSAYRLFQNSVTKKITSQSAIK